MKPTVILDNLGRTFSSVCFAQAITCQRDRILRSIHCLELNPRWTDSADNNLLHLVFKDNCIEYSLKLDTIKILVEIGVGMHDLNKNRETPLIVAVNLKNRLNCNALLAVEHNECQR